LGGAGYLKAIWPDFVGCVFEVCPASGARESLRKCGGLRPPHFRRLSRVPGAGQTSKMHPQRIRPDCLQVPRMETIFATQACTPNLETSLINKLGNHAESATTRNIFGSTGVTQFRKPYFRSNAENQLRCANFESIFGTPIGKS
jgi:hypothetical protein